MSVDRVIVVDDEPDYRSLMRAHLERRGYEVADAGNGIEALELIKHEDPFAVMVLDLMMPEMDGLELLGLAREHDPDMEVVVISGVGTLESAISAMRMGGAYDYLPKPLDTIRDLSVAVERAAEHRRLRIERSSLQEQVAAERARLQTVIENTKDALISANGGGAIAVVNPSALALLGADSADDLEEAGLPPALLALIRNWRQLAPGRPIVTELSWPPGRVQLVSLGPLSGAAQNGGAGWIMVMRDISDARQTQQIKMSLLAQAAEGLRAPLADAMQALLDLNEAGEEAGERFTEAAQRGMNNLGTIRDLTEEVLALVDLEAGLTDMAARPLAEIASGLPDQLRGDLLDQNDLSLSINVDKQVTAQLPGEAARKLLVHMVQQAAWRSPPTSEIAVDVEMHDEQLWIKVQDLGDALIMEGEPELFEELAASAGDLLKEVGLSLAIVKSAAQVLGGQVWVWSENGSNTFAVSIPIAAGDGAGSGQVAA